MSAGIFAGVIATEEFAPGLSQRGTDGSNPSPSSAESAANFVFGREAWKGPRRRQGTIPTVSTDRGQVSWLSPVARALMKAHQGDIVELRAPSGVKQIEVLAIRYGVADSKAC